VIAVRYHIMSAIRAMLVVALCAGRAPDGRGTAHFDHVLVDVAVMHMVHVAIMKVVSMSIMAHASMAAILAVLMRMAGVMLLAAIGHEFSPRRDSGSPRKRLCRTNYPGAEPEGRTGSFCSNRCCAVAMA
jgi:hypothetical protein